MTSYACFTGLPSTSETLGHFFTICKNSSSYYTDLSLLIQTPAVLYVADSCFTKILYGFIKNKKEEVNRVNGKHPKYYSWIKNIADSALMLHQYGLYPKPAKQRLQVILNKDDKVVAK